ncbi:MAG: glycine cleavage system aminomethyltransferase GcvT [bacterium]|nr:glycine cleavage system aminomethyltransferase GcvT [bacterium]MXV91117.1 glycine cleavage system aminomethyltransferase GcvT [Acidimicrobiia bacterium]MYC45831.1 glycine cleavage system aminomethyltransferase GcvT [Acidimicrobiia bacterium]MYI20655.1 glycine cleavage system aminomethyltransferase GcvT [Acidimicrobiia bacterium]
MGGNAEPGNDAGLRRLALRDRHEAAGARFAPFAGWEMPLQYHGTVREHEAVREQVGVFDVSHLGRAWLRGPRAATLLRSVTTFDVTTLEAGSAHYSLYCNEAGGIDDDVFVYHLPGERWLIVHNAANAEQDFERLRSVADDAEEVTADTVMLAVQGPDAIGLLGKLLAANLARLAPRHCVELDWNGAAVLFARTGYTGEDGGECIVDAGHAGALWDALMDGGATPVGLGARDTLRLEAALPLHGNDIDATTHPYEAGLGFAVSLDDGAPFTGRGALATTKARPRTRRLGHLAARGRGVPRAGHAVCVPGGETVAHLTSGGFSPTLGHGIGMAYLPTEHATPGMRFEVDVRGRALPVEVVRRPFYRKARDS